MLGSQNSVLESETDAFYPQQCAGFAYRFQIVAGVHRGENWLSDPVFPIAAGECSPLDICGAKNDERCGLETFEAAG